MTKISIVPKGFTFWLSLSSQCIQKWIKDGHNTCPNCREPVSEGDWKDNKPLQQIVDDLPYTCKYRGICVFVSSHEQ
jgi:hypothetical protein